jgi:hypothetical protein
MTMKKALIIGATLLVLAIAASAASRKGTIQLIYQPQENGDYRLSIYGGRELVCEEQPITVTQPTALDPIVLDCSHRQPVREPQLAEGEWKIDINVPPCTVKHGKPNITVDFQPNLDKPTVATIHCDAMPVVEH